MLNDAMYERFAHFLKKHSLRKYHDPRRPAIFFSLWGMGALKIHKSFGLVIWRGTDVLKIGSRLRSIKKRTNIRHVAISSFIASDLDAYKIKYKSIPIVGVNNKYFYPTPKGNEIYVYIPENNEKYYNRYGGAVVDKIRSKCKYHINIVRADQYTRKELANVYRRCFCGLRLTKHDGLPNQVIEMGLMGRKSFYNGNIPGSIKWSKKRIDDIISNINREAETIGTIDYDYSEKISNFIDVGDAWKNTGFWK